MARPPIPFLPPLPSTWLFDETCIVKLNARSFLTNLGLLEPKDLGAKVVQLLEAAESTTNTRNAPDVAVATTSSPVASTSTTVVLASPSVAATSAATTDPSTAAIDYAITSVKKPEIGNIRTCKVCMYMPKTLRAILFDWK